MTSDSCPIAEAAVVSAVSLRSRPVFSDYGALASNDGEASLAYASIPGVTEIHRERLSSFLGGFIDVMYGALRYKAFNLPIRSGPPGAVQTPGVTEPELATFHAVMRRLGKPVWIEFELDATSRGTLCIPLPDRRAYMFLDVAVDVNEGVCAFFPYFTETRFEDDAEPVRSVFDPVGVFDRLANAEAERFGIEDPEEIVDMMTRDADAAVLAICSMDYASTVVVGDPRDGARMHAGRDASVDARRRVKGLQVW